VVGVGVRLNDQLATAAGLNVDNGIVVDKFLRTSASDVYAAGDVARFPSLTGTLERVEHFDHAYSSGGAAGRNMAGANEPYRYVPFFWSDVFELGFEFVGTATPDSRVAKGDLDGQSFVIEYSKDGKVVGALLAGRSPEESAKYRGAFETA
jgi:NADPH-dependent 2,4-dienoyl-CoA reductase/sulfur reductase-like enzyme